MSRNLYRGKRISTGEWVYGYLVRDNLILDGKLSYPVDLTTIGQYTGLNTEGTQQIFEKDIMRSRDGNTIGEVIYRKGHYLLNTAPSFPGDKWGTQIWDAVLDDFEVVGNTIDNPELIEEENVL